MPELDLGQVVGSKGDPGNPGKDALINGQNVLELIPGTNMSFDDSAPGRLVLNVELGSGTGYIPVAEKGIPDGVATLDSNGKVPSDQLPEILTGDYIETSEKGQPNGVATLDEGGTLTKSQLPYDVVTLGSDGKIPASQLPVDSLSSRLLVTYNGGGN